MNRHSKRAVKKDNSKPKVIVKKHTAKESNDSDPVVAKKITKAQKLPDFFHV